MSAIQIGCRPGCLPLQQQPVDVQALAVRQPHESSRRGVRHLHDESSVRCVKLNCGRLTPLSVAPYEKCNDGAYEGARDYYATHHQAIPRAQEIHGFVSKEIGNCRPAPRLAL